MRVPPGTVVDLARTSDPGATGGFLNRRDAEAALVETSALISDYQARLAAQDRVGVLVLIQGIDASGKDGTIKHVMDGVNPAGVPVHSFKVPSAEELSHDYLWRFNSALPRRGEIAIFNRSHYEEVLVVRVHPENLVRQRLPDEVADPTVWTRRQEEINAWERYLTANGIRVVKLFLNVSKDEQRARFLERIDRTEKNWKFSAADINERQYWDQYQRAFSDMLTKTSTTWAPWFVIPADHKWFARLAVAAVIVDALMEIDPQFPKVSDATKAALEAARRQLIAEPGTSPGTQSGKPSRASRPPQTDDGGLV